MKPTKYFLYLTFVCLTFFNNKTYSQQNNSGTTLDKDLQQRLEKKTIPAAQKGDLICTDANGKYILCTGNEFEKVLGFTTNVPYVTPNKPADPNGNKDEFEARASLKNGEIKAGDYVCPCGEAGKVAKCKQNDNAYAKALNGASANGQLFVVKVLGSRR